MLPSSVLNYDHLIWFNSSAVSFYKHKVDRLRNGSEIKPFAEE